MKKNFEKRAFALIFMVALLLFSGLSLAQGIPEILEEIAEREEGTTIPQLITMIDDEICDNIYLRDAMLEGYGASAKAVGKHEFNGFSFVVDKDGYLHPGNFWANINDFDVNQLGVDLERFQTQLQEQGTELLVMTGPQKYDASRTRGYYGTPYGNATHEANLLHILLRRYRVPALDCREVLADSGIAYENLFYRTDANWTSDAAFYCFRELIARMDDLGFDPDPHDFYTDLGHYTAITYSGMFLGSQGRDTGVVYAGGKEDFLLLYCDDGSEYEFSYGDKHLDSSRDGKIQETLIDVDVPEELTENPREMYHKDLFDMYLRGMKDYSRSENLSNPDGMKILLLGDSSAAPVAVYLAPMCSQLDIVKSDEVSTEDVWELISDNEYDLVLVCLHPDHIQPEYIHFSNVDEEEVR